MNDSAAAVTAAAAGSSRRGMGSLTRRMTGVAALWIVMLLLLGGFALDRVLQRSIVRNFDNQLEYVLNAMIAASEIGPDGEVRFNRPPADQRFIETYSGVYFKISGAGRPGEIKELEILPYRKHPQRRGIGKSRKSRAAEVDG